MRTRTDAARRARLRRVAQHAAACDRFVRWAHGTAVFASDLPHYYDVNVVRCEDAPDVDAADLADAAEGLQADLPHRRVEVWDEGLGERVRPGFAALGWDVERHVWMLHDGRAVPPPAVAIEALALPEVRELRATWIGPEERHLDALLDQQDLAGARRLGELRTTGVRDAGAVVAFARTRIEPAAAELEELYVAESHRGRGLGRALTLDAMAAAGSRELWVEADDEDWPKRLYASVGFLPVWIHHSFTRLPR